MVAIKGVREDMTANSLNHLMRTKLHLNSQVLSKTTNEMVSTCIAKLYKQAPNRFRDSLQQIKVAAARIENRGPLRTWKNREQKLLQSAKVKPTTKPYNEQEMDLLSTVMKASRRSCNHSQMGTNKQLLKSPNYKIYSQQWRYGSSASSSNGSLFRRMDKKKLSKREHYVQTMSHLKKSRGITHGPKTKSPSVLHGNAASIKEPARNQHMRCPVETIPKAFEVSSSIQKDLMIINDILKKRMRVSAQKAPVAKEPKCWGNPPSPELFGSRNEKIFAHSELQEQHKRLQNIGDAKSVGTYKQVKEVCRNSPALSSKVIRKSFGQLSTKKFVSLKPNPIYLSDALSALQYFANRETLSERTSQEEPECQEASNRNFSINKFNRQTEKPYKINGRIASPTVASLAHVAAAVTTRRYNRINYLNLSSQQFKGVQQQ